MKICPLRSIISVKCLFLIKLCVLKQLFLLYFVPKTALYSVSVFSLSHSVYENKHVSSFLVSDLEQFPLGQSLSTSELKRFVCDICFKTYKDRGTLNRHKKGHSDIKPYQCTVCSKRFIRKDYLSSHMVTHANFT